MFTCTVDLFSFHAAVTQTKQEFLRQTVRAVNEGARAGVAEAKAVGAFQDRTGNLRTRIRSTDARSMGDAGAEAEMVSSMGYSAIVESGSRAHPIFPRAGRSFKGPLRQGQTRGRRSAATPRLAFTVGGRIVFARMVNHPGTRGTPFMGPAALKAEAVMNKYLENIPAQVAKFWD